MLSLVAIASYNAQPNYTIETENFNSGPSITGIDLQLPSTMSDSDSENDSNIGNKTYSVYVSSLHCCIYVLASHAACCSHDPEISSVEYDFGKLLEANIDIQKLSRDHKYQILTMKPSSNPSAYPFTRFSENGPLRRFKPEWTQQYPWLYYSSYLDGAFCRACMFFAPDIVGGQIPGQFITKPFKLWGVKSQKMNMHATSDYHMTSLTMMEEFLNRYRNPSEMVHTKLDTEAQRRMKDNQEVIESLLRVIMVCGKQGLALCGHRDDKILWDDELDLENHGNFIELVRFRAETDMVLAKHLMNAPKNAHYTSKTIQNQLISVIGTQIRNDILAEVKESQFYSILSDEVSDISNKEQISLTLRYVTSQSCEYRVKEMFVDFIEVERITGKALAEAILQHLSAWGLSVADLRGQCYDGASNMSGARSGCKAIIQKEAPKAVYIHCAAHRLNLAIVSACRIQAFRNCESYIGEIARFFKFSAKRQRLLDKAIDTLIPNARAKKLKDACKTRWIQHIDAYATFLELLPALHMSLQAIIDRSQYEEELGSDWNWDSESITKANGFFYQLECSSFLLCFKILLEVLSSLRPLSVKLQMQAMDVFYAYSEIKGVIKTLAKMRDDSEKEFKVIFDETSRLGKDIHGSSFALQKPRTTGRQMHRNNVQNTTDSAEEYFRITLYNEFLSHIISELQERLIDNPSQVHVISLLNLLPKQVLESDNGIPDLLAAAVDYYKADLPLPVMFPTEYRMWVRKWKDNSSEAPIKLVDALSACDAITFPNIKVLLKLALTVPITSCECERSFSQLKTIKTSRRSTMSSRRLGGLALMKINRRECETLQKSPLRMKELVVNFNCLNPRRMKLPFVLAD